MLNRELDQLGLPFNAQLAFDIQAVRFHGAYRQVRRPGNLLFDWPLAAAMPSTSKSPFVAMPVAQA